MKQKNCINQMQMNYAKVCFRLLLQNWNKFVNCDDADNSQDSREREGTIFIYLYHFSKLTNIHTFICSFVSEMTTSCFLLEAHVITTLLHNEIYQPLGISIWLSDLSCLFCARFYGSIFSQTNGELELTSGIIIITSEPTKQMR